MNFLEKLLDEFKNIMYDFAIYIIPGFISLILIGIVVFLIGEELKFNLVNLIEVVSKANNNIIFFVVLILLSYLFGHITAFYSKVLANMLLSIEKKSNKKIMQIFFIRKKNLKKKYSYLEEINCGLIDKLRQESEFNINCLNDKEVKKIMLTIGSTNSRFEGHNNLIQKYIAKENMYQSLCLLSLVGLIDLLIYAVVNYKELFLLQYNITGSIKNGAILLIFVVCMFGAFKEFFDESIRHGYLRKKEIYMYLYNKFIGYKKYNF